MDDSLQSTGRWSTLPARDLQTLWNRDRRQGADLLSMRERDDGASGEAALPGAVVRAAAAVTHARRRDRSADSAGAADCLGSGLAYRSLTPSEMRSRVSPVRLSFASFTAMSPSETMPTIRSFSMTGSRRIWYSLINSSASCVDISGDPHTTPVGT